MNSVEGQIAVEPFKTNEIKADVQRGFAKIEQKHSLTPLKVVIGNNKFPTGSTVYVPGEACKAPWATKLLKIGDLEFVMMPEGFVVIVDSSYSGYGVTGTNYSGYGVTGTNNQAISYTVDGNGGIFVTGNGGQH